jgi:hypothetical protein
MTLVPPTALLSRIGPCGLFFLFPKLKSTLKGSPISDDRRDRRNFAMGRTVYPKKRVPGHVSVLEKMGAVYKQWRGVL